MGAAICWAAKGGAEATHKDRARPVVDKSRMTAESLLSRWNAPNCGGFNLTTLWEVDTQIAADMVTVFATVPSCHRHPDDLAMVRNSGESSTPGVSHCNAVSGGRGLIFIALA